jgi:ribosome-binding factor A
VATKGMLGERSRHLRVAAELQRVVNDLLQSDVKDPRLEGVRVSEVELSGDLGVAKLFYSTLDPDEDCAPIDRALRKAAGFLRGRVAHEIRLRRMPELKFLHDTTARQASELSRLLAAESGKPRPDSGED